MAINVENVLNPYKKITKLNTSVVMIVGYHGVGKHQLAKSIIGQKVSFSLETRTATSLPLPEENAVSRPKIDFLIFMVDLTSRKSFIEVEKSLAYVDPRYFLGKCCFVITETQNVAQRSVEIEMVSQMADAYDTPLLFVNLQKPEDADHIAKQLVNLVEIASGFKTNVTPLIVDTTRHPYKVDVL